MTDHVNAVLEQLVPRFEDERGDWERVLRDARSAASAPVRSNHVVSISQECHERRRERRTRWVGRRRLVIVAAVLAAIAIPLAAVAAAQQWWFFKFGGAPSPVTGVTVVRTGSWEGKEWELLAYLSSTDGICYVVAPAGARGAGEGAAMNCDQIEGVPRTPASKPYTPHGITFLAGSAGDHLPAYIAGPVVDSADHVEIHLASGAVLTTHTFDAPDELGTVRFYATQLPETTGGGPLGTDRVRRLIGLDNKGRIVACLVVPMPAEGVPLSACR